MRKRIEELKGRTNVLTSLKKRNEIKDHLNTQPEENPLVRKVHVLRGKNKNVGPKVGTICPTF